jgi:hypothetical protein
MKMVGTIVTIVGIVLLAVVIFLGVNEPNDSTGAVAAALAGIGIVIGGIALMYRRE